MSSDDEISYIHRRRKRDASKANIGAARLNKKQFGALERFMEKLEQRFGQSNWTGAFRTFDYDKDGQITREEFKRGVKDIGYDPDLPEVRAVADLATSDETGEIGYAGFAKTMNRIQNEIFAAKGLATSKYAAQAVGFSHAWVGVRALALTVCPSLDLQPYLCFARNDRRKTHQRLSQRPRSF